MDGFTSTHYLDRWGKKVDYEHNTISLAFVEICHGGKRENMMYQYFITLSDNVTTCKYLLLFSPKQKIAFERQFPCFPYDRALYFAQLNDKKLEIIEKQNIALLSHLETIMTCLRLRAITDDNLDFEIPQPKE